MVARTASDTAETMRWNVASFNDPEGLCAPSTEVVAVGASSTEETTLTACRCVVVVEGVLRRDD